MLTPLQERVARIVASLKDAEGLALAGGMALIERGDVERSTRDLEFFGLSPDCGQGQTSHQGRVLAADPLPVAFPEKNSDSRTTVPKSAIVALPRTSWPNSLSLCPASFRIGTTDPGAVAAKTIPTNRGARIWPAARNE